MRARVVLAATAATLAAVPTVGVADAGAAAAGKARLTAFDSCGALVRFARSRGAGMLATGWVPSPQVAVGTPTSTPGGPLPQTGAEGTPAPAPTKAPAADGVDYSTTNVQEQGVDEPDVVKSDGTRIYAISGGRLLVVDARAKTPRLLGSLKLDEGWGHELLVHGRRALIIWNASLLTEPQPLSTTPAPPPTGTSPTRDAALVPEPYARAVTRIAEVDLRDPAAPRVVRTERIDGTYVSARLNGATARVVTSSTPRAFDVVATPTTGAGQGAPARTAALRPIQAIRRAGLKGWMPSSFFRDRRTGRRSFRALASCDAVQRPTQFSGLDMLTIVTIDLDKGLPAVDSDAVMTDAQIVYGSSRSLFVATRRWLDPRILAAKQAPSVTTAIHEFDASTADATRHVASGEVPGFLLSQWSLSERDGFLRVASTEQPEWWGQPGPPGQTESAVTVLEERPGALVAVGRVGGLGRGEQLRAVRFIDDVGYVVTFRQVDPLYTIDVSRPTAPKVAGELKLLGYSAYLHPIGKDLLLGVGQDATEQGRVRGTQLSLFDVSDPAHPALLDQHALGAGASSEAEFDHHAFLYWPPTGLAALPVQAYGSFTGAIGFRVARGTGIDELGRIAHPTQPSAAPIRRAFVLGDRLLTISDGGLKASDLKTLADVAWLPFPAPVPPPVEPPAPKPVTTTPPTPASAARGGSGSR